jgi:hypothetical protein
MIIKETSINNKKFQFAQGGSKVEEQEGCKRAKRQSLLPLRQKWD